MRRGGGGRGSAVVGGIGERRRSLVSVEGWGEGEVEIGGWRVRER